ncbi:hypothetical protein HDG34_003285 [Paraburkholderia sp. HC6.4b]|uniref:hypothetical protein n=1 Tax=unclassified Paraburkholderia TaxID=2615204 RepID=UPI00160F1258|nr:MULTISPECIES: hypothetical protein [unclassified Paraburkholderia]MBB5409344.1 hypothetical protein [Paraburkholderia sp. HC6.4b]MBB5451072.1 hypothetical protein [Paraburkholderia sp. Kb1A]
MMLTAGDESDFDALVYGGSKHPGTIAYLQKQLEPFSGGLTEFGRQFAGSARNLFDAFNGSEAMRLARAAVRRVDSLFMSDTIQTIWDIGRLQNAPLTMQRWIMAEPETRRLYHQQRCDGYSESYVDMDPGLSGEDHYDWRRIHDGVAQETADGQVVFEQYWEPLRDGDRHLELDEQSDIIATHEFARAYALAGKEDHTSKEGGML